MIHDQLQPSTLTRSRADLFMDRYGQLRVWAKRLTGNDPGAGEDLVHDAFLQFVRGRTNVELIENVEGYLRQMLRYVHLSKINRNFERLLDRNVSISDCDSVHETETLIEVPDRIQSQEEITQICAYASLRKETSRSGSVLILRYFHQCLPTEIAPILCTTRHSVDEWQRVARRELKEYLAKAQRLRTDSARAHSNKRATVMKLSGIGCDVLEEARQIIFSSRQGHCYSSNELVSIYKHDHSEAVTTTMLAHLVSCFDCLDSVNRIVGLPSLAERY